MYGAYWCPHCQAQKKLFGESFQYVHYVECTKEVKKCEEKKINGYPTWIFKNNERISREVSLEELAQKSKCNSQSQTSQSAIQNKSVKEVKELLEKNKNITLLDVRTSEEFKTGHIANSTLFPVDTIQQKAETIVKDKNTKLVVYCRTGKRSKKAAETLKSLGYNNIINMEGGITAWQQEGYQIVK